MKIEELFREKIKLGKFTAECQKFLGNKCLIRGPPRLSTPMFFSHRKLQQNKYTATMASAALRLRQIIGVGGGAPIKKVGGGAHKLSAAARPAHGSTSI